MEALAWGGVLHYGTQNASRVGLFAARTNLETLSADDGKAFKWTWQIGDQLVSGLRQVFREAKIEAIVQSVGPMLQIMLFFFLGYIQVKKKKTFKNTKCAFLI